MDHVGAKTMREPQQPAYSSLVPSFLGALFAPTDQVVLAQLYPDTRWENMVKTRDASIAWLLANEQTPNVYFRASAHDGGTGYTEANCVSTRAFFIDVDYGQAGHNKKSTFATMDDALGYLITLPIRPSIAWHTGHGIQAAFLLHHPCVFHAGGGTDEALLRYRTIGKKLAEMAMADSAFTPEHAYRVPLTLNRKVGTTEVRGTLLWSDPSRSYTMEEIEKACAHYGIKDKLANHDSCAASGCADDRKGITAKYDDLPGEIRDEIEGDGERSDRLFSVIGRMVRAGYTADTIQEAARHGDDFVAKYDARSGGLNNQVLTCIEKVRAGHYVYTPNLAPPIRIYNVPVPVPLSECQGLPTDLNDMLDRYESVAGIKLATRVRDAARFHEHMVTTRPSGVLESPCGAGKSVWALCHIALHAGDQNRYLYVAETVDALYRAADTLEKLTTTQVGRVHGFNADKCHALCRKTYTWRQCNPDNPKSVCQACPARQQCAYYTRAQQITRPIVCMTHSGLIRAMEDGSAVLDGASVFVDEGLSTFNTWQVAIKDLEILQRLTGMELGRLFPHTSLANRTDHQQWQIADDAALYARRNYVYRDEQQTSALRDLYGELRTHLSTGLRPHLLTHQPEDIERARDTLAELTNFFRPSLSGDATYAYHEMRDDTVWMISAKRNRFSFQSQRKYQRLWMLNASAQIAPYQYPDVLPVYTCPNLPDNSNLVTLHCIRANPTKTRQDETVRLSNMVIQLSHTLRQHKRILVAIDKDSEVIQDIDKQISATCGADAQVMVLQRGRIKGVNTAGDCTLAYLGSMATFTGLDDCALHACIHYGRTFPDQPYVFSASGAPNWPGGRMMVPAMRSYYALRSLDEIYQAVWRTAVRNDKPVEAIVVLPDEHWLTALWRTVMPGFQLGSAYLEKRSDEEKTVAGQKQKVHCDYERDPHLFGLRIISMGPGQEIKKTQVAEELGYTGSRAWEKNKDTIMGLLEPFFEDGSTNRMLRRKPAP